eukprot:gene20534-27324_t
MASLPMVVPLGVSNTASSSSIASASSNSPALPQLQVGRDNIHTSSCNALFAATSDAAGQCGGQSRQSLKAVDRSPDLKSREAGAPPVPSNPPSLSVNYFISRTCNYACKFCFHTAKTSDMLQLEEAMRGLTLLYEAGTRKVNFAGGEPFLHPNFLGRLCKHSHELGMNVSIITNGSLTTKEWMDEFGPYVDIMGVSVDSFNEETNRRIGRGNGTHVTNVWLLKYLCDERGIKFKLNTVVNIHNWEEDMNEHIQALGPSRWKVFQVLLLADENTGDVNSLQNATALAVSAQQTPPHPLPPCASCTSHLAEGEITGDVNSLGVAKALRVTAQQTPTHTLWKVFQVLLLAGENTGDANSLRDATTLTVTPQQTPTHTLPSCASCTPQVEGVRSPPSGRWKVFQVLLLAGENTGDANSLRDATALTVTAQQFQEFLQRHSGQRSLVPEDNSEMQNSYLLLDEQMRFLDCSNGSKEPSESILEVGVDQALSKSGFDMETFLKRGGVYEISASATPISASATLRSCLSYTNICFSYTKILLELHQDLLQLHQDLASATSRSCLSYTKILLELHQDLLQLHQDPASATSRSCLSYTKICFSYTKILLQLHQSLLELH